MGHSVVDFAYEGLHCFARKFGDIGNTIQLQYQQEKYHMTSGWAQLVTCHPLPGPCVIEGLGGVAPKGSGCVLVAEMSSEGALTSKNYTQGYSLWNV